MGGVLNATYASLGIKLLKSNAGQNDIETLPDNAAYTLVGQHGRCHGMQAAKASSPNGACRIRDKWSYRTPSYHRL